MNYMGTMFLKRTIFFSRHFYLIWLNFDLFCHNQKLKRPWPLFVFTRNSIIWRERRAFIHIHICINHILLKHVINPWGGLFVKNLLFKHFAYIHTMSGKFYNTHKAMTKLLICTYFILFAFQYVCWELERTYLIPIQNHVIRFRWFSVFSFFFLFFFSLFSFFLFFYAFILLFSTYSLEKNIIYSHFQDIFTISSRKGSVFHELHERDLTLHHHQIEWSTSSLIFM